MVTESVVRKILARPLDYDWIAQGLGLFRLALGGGLRLHIWDPGAALNSDVAWAHNHPWHILDSTIIYGRLGNQRYARSDEPSADAMTMQEAHVACGIGSRLVDEPVPALLVRQDELEVYGPGDSYDMGAHEVHESFPEPGTVTLMHKSDPVQDVATIYWSGGAWRQEGFTRNATPQEVLQFVELGRARM